MVEVIELVPYVCVSVCLSVCQLALSRPNELAYQHKRTLRSGLWMQEVLQCRGVFMYLRDDPLSKDLWFQSISFILREKCHVMK